jgi:prepilin-type N-terminal cleavage/methylation domain-containing protein
MSLRAFTLIEVLVSLAVATIIASIGLAQGLDSYSRSIAESDHQYVLSAIMRARAEAMSSDCLGVSCPDAEPHGVYVTPKEVVIFQGTSYATRFPELDEVFPLSGNMTISSSSEIVFETSSGDVVIPASLQVEKEIISVAADGRITISAK